MKSLGVVAGVTVRVHLSGQGGGKSAGDMEGSKQTKQEKIRMKEMEVKVLLNTLKGLNQPSHADSVKVIMTASTNTSPKMMKDAIALMNLENLRIVQNAMNNSNNEATRIDAITKAVYFNVFNTVMELNDFQRTMLDASRSTIQFAMLKTYAGDNGRLGWDIFRADVEAEIEKKCVAMGVSMASTAGHQFFQNPRPLGNKTQTLGKQIPDPRETNPRPRGFKSQTPGK